MKNPNQFPTYNPEESEEILLEKYQKAYLNILEEIFEKNPYLDRSRLEYKDDLILAKSSEFPVIGEDFNLAKSIYAGELCQDNLKITEEIKKKLEEMFDYFYQLIDKNNVDIRIDKFPKPQDMARLGNINKKLDKNVVLIETFYANANTMLNQGKLTKKEVEIFVWHYLKSLFGNKKIY